MSRDVRYLPSAKTDLLEIVKYIARDNPPAALALVELLDKTIGHLAEFPELGREPKDDRLRRLGYRMVVIGDYLAFYVVKNEVIEIRRVIHGSRRYEFLL